MSTLFCILSCVFVVGQTAKQPNIVFILADDYGWNDVGYHGSDIRTPNLDRLANGGIKLENYYVQPTCTPSRTQLLSGRYQIHTGFQHGVLWAPQPHGLPLDSPTFADKLKEVGYSTHMIGKWHIGYYKKEYMPHYRGFDTFYGYLTGAVDYFTHSRCGAMKRHPEFHSMCGTDFRFNDQILKNETGNYSTDLYASRATSIIEHHNTNQPLLLYLAFQAVHSPLEAPQNYIDMYANVQDENRRKYSAMSTCMDDAVAKVELALKSAGMWDNTIFIFSTDNGGDVDDGGNNWPLRGWKATEWEGGIRGVGFVTSPLLPSSLAGTVNKELMHVTDWFPTMVNLGGGNFNQVLPLDGYDQWSTISNGHASPRKEFLINIDTLSHHHGDQLYDGTFDTRIKAGLRVGDMKILTGNPGTGLWRPVPGNGSDINLHELHTKNCWLFNITADPYEQHDLSASDPTTVRSMLDRLAFYESTSVPVSYPDPDPAFDPTKHGDAYEPWVNSQNVVG